jgi:xanthine dehydrogenase accessory factor
MQEVLEQVEAWIADGKRVALATVIGTEHSAPRDPGAALAVNDDGEVVGSVSGGCVESAVVLEAMEVLTSGVPRRLSYGIADDDAFAVGLTCGGTIHLFVERVDW